MRLALVFASLFTVAAAAAPPSPRTFPTAEAAVLALRDAVSTSNLDEVIAIFGPDGEELASSSDPAIGRRHRDVFIAAMNEQWHLASAGANRKTLVIGNEAWPFPVPIVKIGSLWRFDTAAGREEVIARRIGRNELATIVKCRAFAAAQQRDPRDVRELRTPETPVDGYYYRVVASGDSFTLVAWPAEYDTTGVMTFVVSKDGVVRQKDLGPDTATRAAAMAASAPDASWHAVR